jgi:excisionase family DNA binding protein
MNPGNFCLQSKTGQFPKANGTKTGQFSGGFLTPGEAATLLNVSQKTVVRWCKAGKLLGIPKPHGDSISYTISLQAIQLFMATHREPVKTGRPRINPVEIRLHADYITSWEKAMTNGLMTGKPFSPHTVTQYRVYVEKFLKKYPCVAVEHLKSELLEIPADQFGKKDKFYKSVISFGKFLIDEKALDEAFLEQAKKLKPKRHKPPRRTTVDENQLIRLIEACETSMERALVILLASTGLRASECASLCLNDLDFEKQTLLVRFGKGNKIRKVGLNASVIETLKAYLLERPKVGFDTLFLNQLNQPIDRHGIRQRLERLGKQVDVVVTPHALRRAFVTINANKGRSLVMLQIACGHADIKTTRTYCQTTEEEVIQAMKEWE